MGKLSNIKPAVSNEEYEVADLTSQLASLNYRVAKAESTIPENIERKKKVVLNEASKEDRIELALIEKEVNRRRYLKDPVHWVETYLGEFLWSKQQEIMESIVSHRRTAVPSCFGSGKSFVAARIAAWWVSTHPPGKAKVVTTATTGVQVKAILWKEIHRAFNKGNLPGRVNQTEWWLPVGNGKEEIVAFGRKPQDMDAAAFQGIHDRFVLVILDEADGISETLFEAADSLIVNDFSRILAIGNPEDATSYFANVCKPGSSWNTIQIPAFVTPNFTDEPVPNVIKEELISSTWVEEKRKKWGETNPMWIAKVLAQFPTSQTDGLIPIQWIRDAQQRKLVPGLLKELGVDVGAGGDKSVTACRRGGVVRIIRRDHNPDTMQTTGNIIHDLEKTGASVAKIDMIGIGRGVVDRGKEQGKPFIGVNVGSKPKEEKAYINLRAEAYWMLREIFQAGDIDLPNEEDGDEGAEDLAAQLVDIRYKRTSQGKIQIESKEELKRRTKCSSPDESDAIMLAFLKNVVHEVTMHDIQEF